MFGKCRKNLEAVTRNLHILYVVSKKIRSIGETFDDPKVLFSLFPKRFENFRKSYVPSAA